MARKKAKNLDAQAERGRQTMAAAASRTPAPSQQEYVARYQERQATEAHSKKQVRTREAKKRNKGGFQVPSPILTALKQFDDPGDVIRSRISDVSTAIDRGDLGKLVESISKSVSPIEGAKAFGAAATGDASVAKGAYAYKTHEKDVAEHAGVGTYLDRGVKGNDIGFLKGDSGASWLARTAIGFAGDVGTDPLTYVAPEAKLAGGSKAVSRAILREGGEKAAQTAIREARGIGYDAIKAEAKRGAEEAATKVAKKGASSLTSEEAQKYLGVKGGLKLNVPGTGRVSRGIGRALHLTDAREPTQLSLIPKGIAEKPARALAALTRAPRATKVGEFVSEKLASSGHADLERAARSGVAEKAVPAMKTLDAAATENAYAGVLSGQLKDEYAKISKDAKGNIDAVARHIHGDEGALHELVSKVGTERADDLVERLSNFTHELYLHGKKAGLNIQELENYTPRRLTKEVTEALKLKPQAGDAAGKASLERARVIKADYELGNGTKVKGTTEHAIRSEVDKYARDVLGISEGFYEKSQDKVFPAYIDSLTRRIGRKNLERRLVEAGVAKDAVETVSKGAKKGAKAAAGKKQQILDEVLGKIDTEAKASQAARAEAEAGAQNVDNLSLGFDKQAQDLRRQAEVARAQGQAAPDLAATQQGVDAAQAAGDNPQPFLDQGVTREEKLAMGENKVAQAEGDVRAAERAPVDPEAQANLERTQAAHAEAQANVKGWQARWDALSPAEKGDLGNVTHDTGRFAEGQKGRGGAILKARDINFEEAGQIITAHAETVQKAARFEESAVHTLQGLKRNGWKLNQDGTMRLDVLDLGRSGDAAAEVARTGEEQLAAGERVAEAMRTLGYDVEVRPSTSKLGNTYTLDVNPVREHAAQLRDAAATAEAQKAEALKALPTVEMDDLNIAVQGDYYHGAPQDQGFSEGVAQNSNENLAGAGLYTTQDPAIAQSYMTKGTDLGGFGSREVEAGRLQSALPSSSTKVGDPTVYSLEWAHPDRPPHLIELDQPFGHASPEEVQQMRDMGITGKIMDDAEANLAKDEAGIDAWMQHMDEVATEAEAGGVAVDRSRLTELDSALRNREINVREARDWSEGLTERWAYEHQGVAMDDESFIGGVPNRSVGYLMGDPGTYDAVQNIKNSAMEDLHRSIYEAGIDGWTETGGQVTGGPEHAVSIFFNPAEDTKIVGKVSYKGKLIGGQLDQAKEDVKNLQRWTRDAEAQIHGASAGRDEAVRNAAMHADAARVDLAETRGQIDYAVHKAGQERMRLQVQLSQEGIAPSRADALQRQDSLWQQHEELMTRARDETDQATRQAGVLEAQAAAAEANLEKSGAEAATTVNELRSQIRALRSPRMKKQFISELDDASYSILNKGAPEGEAIAAPDHIVEALNQVRKVREDPTGLLKHYDAALNYLKAWQIATPGFHLRNFMGGMFNNYLAGVEVGSYNTWWKYEREYGSALKEGIPREEMSQKARMVADIKDHIALEGQYSGSEIETGGHHAGLAQRLNPASKKFAYLHANQAGGGQVEHALRGSLALDTMLKGGTIDDALSQVNKYHFDYAALTPFEKSTVKRIIPFYTWTRKNLPLQLENMAKQPGKYAHYYQLKQEISRGQKPDGLVPGYITGDLGGFKTPLNFGGGSVYATPDLPFTQTLEQSLPFDETGPSPDNYLSQVTPLLKSPIEAFTGRQAFKHIPLTSKTDQTWGNIPGLSQALKATGVADDKGNVSYHDAYFIEQYLPVLGRLRRLAPNEKRKQDSAVTSWLSFMGLPLKTNTRDEQQREAKRRAYQNFANNSTVIRVPRKQQ